MSVNPVFIKIKDSLVVNLNNISHLEVMDSSNPPQKYATLFLLRSQNGDRLFLSKTEYESLMNTIGQYIV
jgi:hypothetical protein